MDHDRQRELDRALTAAAEHGRTEQVKRLLAAGADVCVKDAMKSTLLHKASFFGNTGCIKLLIEAGADINTADGYGWTPLHEAVYCGHIDCMRILIGSGADIGIRDAEGRTPINILAREYPELCAEHIDELEKLAAGTKKPHSGDPEGPCAVCFDPDI